MVDYYKTLNLNHDASPDEIRQAFRKLARKYHPDLNPGDSRSEATFKKINEAYEVLANPENRKKYNQYGDDWKHADRLEEQRRAYGRSPLNFFSSGTRPGHSTQHDNLFINLGDIIGHTTEPSNQRKRNTPRKLRTETSVTITLEEAFTGTTVVATLTVRGDQRKFEVDIPRGVDTGSIIRISPDHQTDLRIKVTVQTHEHFKRSGDNLELETNVPFEDVILGGEVSIKAISGKHMSVNVLPLTQGGQRIKLKGQGMPNRIAPQKTGNMYLTIRPSLPHELSEEETGLIQEFKHIREKNTRKRDSSAF